MPYPVEFRNDINDTLKQVQDYCFLELVAPWVQSARQRYLKAAHLVASETEMVARVRALLNTKSWTLECDLRLLEPAYRRVAAFYRCWHDQTCQMPLPYDNLTYWQWLNQHWREFFKNEIPNLVDNDEVAQAVLSVLTYPEQYKTGNSQDYIAGLLGWHYQYNVHGKPADRLFDDRESAWLA